MTLVGDRTEGYTLAAATGGKLDEPSQQGAIRSVAERAGLSQKKVGPRSIKHSTTHACLRRCRRTH
ncbi:hypothetical protein [Streptomyces sp. NBC_01320]|uniref:hypothetical protein n=1 Tax=Streptomyces sp. NBC_01320 TaxID=2903824 RepID=UPI002E154125|nr:hypothetical protein OG395_55950 [Streptomyces sp. NBC_01320]